MNGSAATAVLPSDELSVGTSRQPSTVWPSSEMIFANSLLTLSRSAGFFGRNNMPDAILARRRKFEAELRRFGRREIHAAPG